MKILIGWGLGSLMFIGVCLLPIRDSYGGQAQELSTAEIVTMLNSENVKTQENGVKSIWDRDSIKKINRTPEIKNALYELLTKTAKPTDSFDKFVQPPLPIRIMCSLGQFKDVRVLPYLLSNIRPRGCTIDSLALIGEPAVNPMLDKLQKGDFREKGAALIFFEILFSTKTPTIIVDGQIISNPYAGIYTPQGAVRGKIRTALKQCLNDKNSIVVHIAIRVLGLIDDPEDKALLVEANKKDPHRITPEKIAKEKEDMKAIRELDRKKKEGRRAKGLPEEEPIEGD